MSFWKKLFGVPESMKADAIGKAPPQQAATAGRRGASVDRRPAGAPLQRTPKADAAQTGPIHPVTSNRPRDASRPYSGKPTETAESRFGRNEARMLVQQIDPYKKKPVEKTAAVPRFEHNTHPPCSQFSEQPVLADLA
jgi:hypothetical protein